jgi:hypothetical protein
MARNRINDELLSNAERQKRHREKKRALGLKPKITWQDPAGFTSLHDRPQISANKFSRALKKITEGMDEISSEEFFGELLIQARRLRQGYDRMKININAESLDINMD